MHELIFLQTGSFVSSSGAFRTSVETKFLTKTSYTEKLLGIFSEFRYIFETLISRGLNLVQGGTGLSFNDVLAFTVDVKWFIKDSISQC